MFWVKQQALNSHHGPVRGSIVSLALIHLVLSFSAVSVRGPVNFLLKTQGDFHLHE